MGCRLRPAAYVHTLWVQRWQYDVPMASNTDIDAVGRHGQVAQAGQETDPIRSRLAALEREVELGQRDARSLVVWPPGFAAGAKLTFPAQPFGPPEDW